MDSKQLVLRPISTKKDGGKVDAARERSSLATASFRVYYSLRAGAVPFLWESKPGTPRSGAVSPAETAAGTAAELLPPLSPPPPHQSSQLKGRRRRCQPRSPWPAVLGALLGALGIRRRSRRRPASHL